MSHWKIILFFVPWILLLAALLVWSMGFNPWGKRTPGVEIVNTTTILEKVEKLGRLELVRYNYNEIYDYQALSSGKITASASLRYYDFSPDMKVALIARGEAVGCIDFLKLTELDIREESDTVYIHLPEPEICYYKLDLDKTRIYDFERKSWWSRIFSDDTETKSVIEKAYQAAEKQILTSAIQGGILEQTNTNAELILRPMLEEISQKKIVFTYMPADTLIAPETN
ncbi:MAG TPA: DUF4230 domain-containing protein [Cyclobacteriaceae bacterium]|nr:DUF4230 domain-containing protein [Cyclobacteriaceae bacterium]